MSSKPLQITDAHTHFFSYTWLSHFYELAKSQFSASSGISALADFLNWELPPVDPRELGRRWVQELDKYGVRRQVLFASKLNDAEYLAAATRAFPERLIGYVMIDPTLETSRSHAHYAIHILGMRGIMLFPAMHRYYASDESVYPIYEEALSAGVPVFIHFGKLSIPIFQKLNLPDNIDLAYSHPEALERIAADFSNITFIVPHFGCGYFDEALGVAEKFDNICFDTASSNSWIQPPLTLREVFRRSLDTLGPERILFGTDSSSFPRGWRKEIYSAQSQALETLQITQHTRELIFGGNISRILDLPD